MLVGFVCFVAFKWGKRERELLLQYGTFTSCCAQCASVYINLFFFLLFSFFCCYLFVVNKRPSSSSSRCRCLLLFHINNNNNDVLITSILIITTTTSTRRNASQKSHDARNVPMTRNNLHSAVITQRKRTILYPLPSMEKVVFDKEHCRRRSVGARARFSYLLKTVSSLSLSLYSQYSR